MFCIEKITRENQNIYWIDIPSKNKSDPLIIFSHGFPDNSFGWENQFHFFNENFKDKFYMIGIFMHGTLNREPVNPKRIHSYELLKDVQTILNIIDPKSEREIYLIGHDLGAFFSIAIHDIMPDRIKGIVHLNGMGLQQYSHRKFSIRQWMKSYYVLLVQFSFFRFLIKNVFPKQFLKIIYKLSQVNIHDPLLKIDQGLFTNIIQYKMLLRRAIHYMGMKIDKIKPPTLFIWGHQDVFLNHPTLNEVNKFYANAEIRIIEGGHWVHSSSTKHVNELLLKKFSQWIKNENV